MPGRDGTGPMGGGPMTGRGMGYCTGAAQGAGYGRGFGAGRGLGMGFGRGRRAGWAGQGGYGYDYAGAPGEDAIRSLQNQVQELTRKIDELTSK